MAEKKEKKVMSKYDYVFKTPRFISEDSLTVPDLVLSMAEIYRKYAVTGDISSLPGKVRPNYFDDGDELDDGFESEEMTDTLLHAKELRESALRQQEKAHPASEDKPQEEEESSKEESSPKPQEPASEPADDSQVPT